VFLRGILLRNHPLSVSILKSLLVRVGLDVVSFWCVLSLQSAMSVKVNVITILLQVSLLLQCVSMMMMVVVAVAMIMIVIISVMMMQMHVIQT